MTEITALHANYDELLSQFKSYSLMGTVQALVEWDMETKMPPKAVGLRSEQLSLISQLAHRMGVDPRAGELLEAIEKDRSIASLSDIERRNVELIRKGYDEETKLPEKLVMDLARQRALAVNSWKKAKAAKDFGAFKPDLAKLVELSQEAAAILKDVKKTKTAYDALIDRFEPKMTSAEITPIFSDLRDGIMKIMGRCMSVNRGPDLTLLQRDVPIDDQREIALSIASFLHYDVVSKHAGGRIDETEHPFTNGYYDDVRITTHYFENLPTSSIFSVLHEAGHATYEQNLRHDWMYQPVGAACSFGFHESQSRFVENMVGRSKEFWEYFFPKLKQLSGGAYDGVSRDAFVWAINAVRPSKVRIEADEVTYGLHIIIRFEIERDLFAGKLKVEELPAVWNEKYREYLGVKVENDSEGVMQDTHWASGLYGYFPSYALGNIYSGQIRHRLETELPTWRDSIARGDFLPVKEWLTKNIYVYGNLYDPMVLLKKVTGEGVNVRHYLDYLDRKCAQLYGY
ncbi:MAG TPA: carboxypeptidase M32 [Conexivisphaerales archaeon]|nr:carboxypeptidase M32 [Conexivisphaerales archaeon]